MSKTFISDRQRNLFNAISEFENLILAIGPAGISANMSGRFRVVNLPEEDRLEVGDGTFHIHMDWSRMKRVEIGMIEIEGRTEGTITFFDGDEKLFRFYRQVGAFPSSLAAFSGVLV